MWRLLRVTTCNIPYIAVLQCCSRHILSRIVMFSLCRWCPVTHHDIDKDIPSENAHIVRTGLLAWTTACAGYLLGWFVITVMFAASVDKSIIDWILACVVTILGVPLSWKTWYRSLYASQMTDKSLHYALFFFHGSVHLAWAAWSIVSPPIWLGAHFRCCTTIGPPAAICGQGARRGVL